uniref:C2 domain-containing protein n=1 Tax=Heterorhabditis bacteriophora TaxID=37862 RepID=A0A1I7XDY6_HETBA
MAAEYSANSGAGDSGNQSRDSRPHRLFDTHGSTSDSDGSCDGRQIVLEMTFFSHLVIGLILHLERVRIDSTSNRNSCLKSERARKDQPGSNRTIRAPQQVTWSFAAKQATPHSQPPTNALRRAVNRRLLGMVQHRRQVILVLQGKWYQCVVEYALIGCNIDGYGIMVLFHLESPARAPCSSGTGESITDRSLITPPLPPVFNDTIAYIAPRFILYRIQVRSVRGPVHSGHIIALQPGLVVSIDVDSIIILLEGESNSCTKLEMRE